MTSLLVVYNTGLDEFLLESHLIFLVRHSATPSAKTAAPNKCALVHSGQAFNMLQNVLSLTSKLTLNCNQISVFCWIKLNNS